MKPGVIIGIIIAVAVIAAGAYFVLNSGNSGDSNTNGNADQNGGTPAAGVPAEENVIVVLEQRPGGTVTASLAVLTAPGYVVIHEASGGQPGGILGASALLQAGQNANVSIALSRPARAGEILYAILHSDTDGNGTFSAAADAPVQSRLGGAIQGSFEISSSASTNPPIINY